MSAAQTTTIPKMAAVAHGAESDGAEARRAAVALRPVVIPDGHDSHLAAHRAPFQCAHPDRRRACARTWGIYTTNLRALVGVGTLLCLVAGGMTFAVLFFLHALPGVVQLLVIQAVHRLARAGNNRTDDQNRARPTPRNRDPARRDTALSCGAGELDGLLCPAGAGRDTLQSVGDFADRGRRRYFRWHGHSLVS